jgi:hypothetical protein
MFTRTRTTAALTLLAFGGLLFASVSASADSWGAISIDLKTAETEPYFGVGGGGSEDEATANAQKFCAEAGGAECKTVVTYQQCGAYAASKTGGGWGKSTTQKTAEDQAMAGCNDDGCKIVTSDCN